MILLKHFSKAASKRIKIKASRAENAIKFQDGKSSWRFIKPEKKSKPARARAQLRETNLRHKKNKNPVSCCGRRSLLLAHRASLYLPKPKNSSICSSRVTSWLVAIASDSTLWLFCIIIFQ